MQQKWRTGDLVEHILSKDWLIVLQYDEYSNRYLCRTKDLREVILYSFELQDPKNNRPT